MQVYRKRSRRGKRYKLYIQLRASETERAALRKAGLMDIKIRKNSSGLGSKRLGSIDLVNTFRAQVNRIRTRWNAALLRTSGFVLVDFIILYFKLIFTILKMIWRLFFGRRQRVGSLLRGMTVSSSKIEDVKEAETFILVTIAALERALAYASNDASEDVIEASDLRTEIAGLVFTGGNLAPVNGSAGDGLEDALFDVASYAENEDADEFAELDGGEMDIDLDI